ncbi:MAG: ROK family protein [Candidatus Omnitrophota bacterium]|nr:ROK family protein [Candidatus Omnitrophota bacterium]
MGTQKHRIIALFTAFLFIFQQVIPAQAAYTFVSKPTPLRAPDAFLLALPAGLGRIEKIISSTKSDPVIYHIQTAHGNFQAQKHIQAILHHLHDVRGVSTVLVEGSAVKLDSELLRLFPGHAKPTMTALELLTQKALVKGVELFLSEEPDAAAYGIENAPAYRASGEAFRDVLLAEQKHESFLAEMQTQIKRLETTLLPVLLRRFLETETGYARGTIPLEDYLKHLREEAKDVLGLDLGDAVWQIDWPMLFRFYRLVHLQDEVDYSAFRAERDRFLSKVRGKLLPALYDEIAVLLDQAVVRDDLPDPETGLLIEAMAAELGPEFSYDDFPNLNRFIGHVILRSELKAGRLFKEIDELAGRLGDALAETDQERALLALLRDYGLVRKLFALELTPSDYDRIIGAEEHLQPRTLAGRFLELNREGRVRDMRFEHLDEINEIYERALAFYRGTKERDHWMIANIKTRLQKTGAKQAVVISGGFHAGPLADHFTAAGFNYALIAPHITEFNGQAVYQESLLKYRSGDLSRETYESPFFISADRSELRGLGIDEQAVTKEVMRAVNRVGSSPALRAAFRQSALGKRYAAVRSELRITSQSAGPAVTGASGDVGATLFRYLNSQYDLSRAVIRSPESRAELEKRAGRSFSADSYVEADFMDRDRMKQLLENANTFYHLAGIVGLGKGEESYPENFKVNGLAALGLMVWAEEAATEPRFIFASTQRVYEILEDADVTAWLEKVLAHIETRKQEVFLDSADYNEALEELNADILKRFPMPKNAYPYELGKRLAEMYLERSRLKNPLAVRISNVYGPGHQSGRKVQRMIAARLDGKHVTEKAEERDYVYVQDVAEILFAAGSTLEPGPEKIVDLASGTVTDTDEIWGLIKKHAPEGTGTVTFKGEMQPANKQDPSWSRRMLGERSFTHPETGVRNQIDDMRYERNLRPKAEGGPVIVVDAGGTHTRVGLWDGEKITDRVTYDTPSYKIATVAGKPIAEMQRIWLERLKQEVDRLMALHPDVKQISIGFAGPTDEEGNFAESAVIWGPEKNLIKNRDLEDYFGLPVRAVNDLTAAVYRYGRDPRFAGLQTLGLITVSSGIGTKLFDIGKGEVIIDKAGRAGEIGHTVVDDSRDAIQEEGVKGELNAYGSGRGIANLARRMARRKRTKALYNKSSVKAAIDGLKTDIQGIKGDDLTEYIAAGVQAGDEFAWAVLRESIRYFVRVLNPYILANAPDKIIFMGGVAESLGQTYLDAVIDKLSERGVYGYTREELQDMFVLGELDGENGLRGAGLLGFNPNQTEPERPYDGGYVEVRTDERGVEAVEARAPNDIQYRDYFTENAFDPQNPILADLLSSNNVIFVTEKFVAENLGVRAEIEKYVEAHGIHMKGEIQVYEGGENIKNPDAVRELTDYAQDRGFDRNGIFVVIGGGAVMDMVGMVAAQYRRKVKYIRIPTTFLGQVDAAVGVKVGIDYRGAKNFVGAFYPPFASITDARFLESLPLREVRGGTAEVIKIAMVSNPGLFETLEEYGTDFIKRMSKTERTKFVRDAAMELLWHLRLDFFENNLMRHVDFGHVLAHKFEAMTGFELRHGEAVAIDVLMSAYIARERGMLSVEDFTRILNLHHKLGQPFYHPALDPVEAWQGIKESIGHKGGRLMMVVPIAIGRTAFIDSLRPDELEDALRFLKTQQDTKEFTEIGDEPKELEFLEEYIESLPENAADYIDEISGVLDDLYGQSIEKLINIASNDLADLELRTAAHGMLMDSSVEIDDKTSEISLRHPGLAGIRFAKGPDGKFRANVPVKTRTAEEITLHLKDKNVFALALDDAVTGQDAVMPEMIDALMELLKEGKTLAFITLRHLRVEDFATLEPGQNLGIVKDLFAHAEFTKDMLPQVIVYASASSSKIVFSESADSRGTYIPVEDHAYTQGRGRHKVFTPAEQLSLARVDRVLLKIHRENYERFDLAHGDFTVQDFMREQVERDDFGIQYFPNRIKGGFAAVANWKIRILGRLILDEYARDPAGTGTVPLIPRLHRERGVFLSKENNQHDDAIFDLQEKGFAIGDIVFIGGKFGGNSINRTLGEIPGLSVVSISPPTQGTPDILQLEASPVPETGPERFLRILRARDTRSELRSIDESRLNPVSREIVSREAAALGSDNLDWILRGVLGKTSREQVSDLEADLFLYEGKLRPETILYRPHMRPADIPHSNRMKKAVRITSSNHPVSTVISESIAQALIEKLRERGVNLDDTTDLSVMGKYTGGLVLAAIASGQLDVPMLTLTKMPYPFLVPDHSRLLRIEEPHMPIDNPEYYSNAYVQPRTRILFLDDESTTGRVGQNLAEKLADFAIQTIGVGVVVQSSPEAEERFLESGLPYVHIDSLKPEIIAGADRDVPTVVPFEQAIPAVAMTVSDADADLSGMPINEYPAEDGRLFTDHPFRGLTMPLSPELARQAGAAIRREIRNLIGDIGERRRAYYGKGRTLFLAGTTPSGILAAVPAARQTRLPLIGAMNRPEPKGYAEMDISDVVNYISLDGYAYSLFGLTAGDAVVLVSGELFDGEEQVRIIHALRDKGVEVLGSISVIESALYGGRERIEAETGVPARSLRKGNFISPDMRRWNATKSIHDSLKYAVMRLEDEVRKLNPDAHVREIRMLPSSFTTHTMIQGSDFDEAYVFVEGVSEHELAQFQEPFGRWISVGAAALDGLNEKAPRLISTWHEDAAVKSYELESLPLVRVYENGRFLSQEELIRNKIKVVRGVSRKQIARIRWFLTEGEMRREDVETLLASRGRDVRSSPRLQALKRLLDEPRETAYLSDAALNWVRRFEAEYTAGKRSFEFGEENKAEMVPVLRELLAKAMIRVWNGKLIPVWRHHSTRFSDRFWTEQAEIVGYEQELNDLDREWLANLPESAVLSGRLASNKPRTFELKKWDWRFSPYLMEIILRSWQGNETLNRAQQNRLIDAFGDGDAFSVAAALELAETREQELAPRIRGKILKLLDVDGEAAEALEAFFGREQTRVDMMIKLLFRWMRFSDASPDAALTWVLENLLEHDREARIPPMVMQNITTHLGKVFAQISDDRIRERVTAHLVGQSRDFRKRSAERGAKVVSDLGLVRKGSVEPGVVPSEAAAATRDRKLLFDGLEAARQQGRSVDALATDWDGTMNDASSSRSHVVNPEHAFWLNWLMEQGKKIVVTTGASYDRFHDQALDTAVNPVPIRAGPNFAVFNDTVAYLNDRPHDYPKFPQSFLDLLHDIMTRRGWHELDIGRPPHSVYYKKGITGAEALSEAEAVRAELPNDVFHYSFVSNGGAKGQFFKIAPVTKAAVFDVPLFDGEKLDPDRTMVAGDYVLPSGIDGPLLEAGRSLRVYVGPGEIDGALNLENKNEAGTLLMLEAFAASTLLEIRSESGADPDEMLEALRKRLADTPAIGEPRAESMIGHVRALVETDRSELRAQSQEEAVRVLLGLFSADDAPENGVAAASYPSVHARLARAVVGTVSPEVSEPTLISGAFGNVDVLLMPEQTGENARVAAQDIRYLTGSVRLAAAAVLEITKHMDMGQALNLHTLPYLLDYSWNDQSPDVYERELAFMKRDSAEAAMGSLLTDGRLFETDEAGNLHLIHMTLGKNDMLASAEKEVYTSVRAVGPAVYTTPVVGGRVSSLVHEHWKNLQMRRNVPADAAPEDYYLVFKAPYTTGAVNRTSNWMDYLGFGRAYLEAVDRAGARLDWAAQGEAGVRSEVVRQYRDAYGFLAKAVDSDTEASLERFDEFWNKYTKAREVMPFLNQVFFEIYKNYVMLYQNDSDSEELRQEAVLNQANYYSVVYEVDPEQRTRFNPELFRPDFNALALALGKRIRGFDPQQFKRFVVERFHTFTAVKLLEGAVLESDTADYAGLAEGLPNLTGLIYYNVVYHNYLKEDPDARHDFELVIADVIREAYAERNILVPVLASLVPTGEAGVWQMPGAEVKVLDVRFDDPATMRTVTIGRELDLRISPEKIVRAAHRALTHIEAPRKEGDRSELRTTTPGSYTIDDVRRALPEFTVDDNAAEAYRREANAVHSLNPDWVLRSILGKASGEVITGEEKRLFLSEGKILPMNRFFYPQFRPAEIPHSNGLKKAVPVTGSDHPISVAAAASVMHAVIEALRAEGGTEALDYVMGKYNAGLLPGLLTARELELPLLTLTKLKFGAFDSALAGGANRLTMAEPHMLQSSPEFESRAVVPPGSRILYVDDEATTGRVMQNIRQMLETGRAELASAGIVLRTSPEALERLASETFPYVFLEAVNATEPGHAPFGEAVRVWNAPADGAVVPFDAAIRHYPVADTKETVWTDHAFRGMSVPLTPEQFRSAGKNAQAALESELGKLANLRRSYYAQGKTLYVAGPTTSGLYGAAAIADATHLPLMTASNRPAPIESDAQTVDYIGANGYAMTFHGLTAGDGIILVTGELTDGEEQRRMVASLHEKGIHVLASVSMIENTRYVGSSRLKRELGIPVLSLQKYTAQEAIKQINHTDNAFAALKYATIRLDEEIKKINPAAAVTEILSMPNSLTMGLTLAQSDFDSNFIVVDGLTQEQLMPLQENLHSWLAGSEMKVEGYNVKPPSLISSEDMRTVWAEEGRDRMPYVSIYKDRTFRSFTDIVAAGENPVHLLLRKHVARIKWLLSEDELDSEQLTELLALLNGQPQQNRSRIADAEIFSAELAERRFSAEVLRWIREIDRVHRESATMIRVDESEKESFLTALKSLVDEKMVDIINGKISAVWREGSAGMSESYWRNLLSVPGLEDEVAAFGSELSPDTDFSVLKRMLGTGPVGRARAIDFLSKRPEIFYEAVVKEIVRLLSSGEISGFMNADQMRVFGLHLVMMRWTQSGAVEAVRTTRQLLWATRDQNFGPRIPPVMKRSLARLIAPLYEDLDASPLRRELQSFLIEQGIHSSNVVAMDQVRKDLGFLGEYLGSVPDLERGRLEEVAEVLSGFGGSLAVASKLARSSHRTSAVFEARSLLARLPLKLNAEAGVIRGIHGSEFVVHDTKRIEPSTLPAIKSWVEIAEALKNKRVFIFDVDDTLIPMHGTISEEMVGLIVGLLNADKIVELNTLRFLGPEGLDGLEKGMGLGFLENIFEHPRFNPRSLSRLKLFSLGSAHKYAFSQSPDGKITADEDLPYYEEHREGRILSLKDNRNIEAAIRILQELDAEESDRLGFHAPFASLAEFDARKISRREAVILYSPNLDYSINQLNKLDNWKLRILQAKASERLREAGIDDFQVHIGDGRVLVLAKENPGKIDGVHDLIKQGFEISQMVFFEDNFEAEGQGYKLLVLPELDVVNVGAPIRGPANLIQPPDTIGYTRKTERILKDHLDGLGADRSELRVDTVTVFQKYRAQTLPLRFEELGTAVLVKMLSGLLGRAAYAEKAGIVRTRPESALVRAFGTGRIRPTAKWKSRLQEAAAADTGQVLLDAAWLNPLIDRNPRALYVLLKSLDNVSAGSFAPQPLVGFAGTRELLDRAADALRNKHNGLSVMERFDAERFLSASRLAELIEVVSPGDLERHIERHHYGVVALSSAAHTASLPAAAVRFILNPDEVSDEDLAAVGFLVPGLLKAASLIRNVPNRAERIRLLESSLQNIVPGAHAVAGGFAVALASYIDEVLVNRGLIEVSA